MLEESIIFNLINFFENAPLEDVREKLEQYGVEFTNSEDGVRI